jgi:hypothetical protein
MSDSIDDAEHELAHFEFYLEEKGKFIRKQKKEEKLRRIIREEIRNILYEKSLVNNLKEFLK